MFGILALRLSNSFCLVKGILDVFIPFSSLQSLQPTSRRCIGLVMKDPCLLQTNSVSSVTEVHLRLTVLKESGCNLFNSEIKNSLVNRRLDLLPSSK